ncbi:MAG: hypothetical protein EPN73_18625 [Paraburkholderia sp.]|nr:MAG: hypothetical protein EPN73_18625 [Paraburkholderia sp.]
MLQSRQIESCAGSLALAIEFTAARIATFDLAGTSSLLGTRLRLQWLMSVPDNLLKPLLYTNKGAELFGARHSVVTGTHSI